MPREIGILELSRHPISAARIHDSLAQACKLRLLRTGTKLTQGALQLR